MRNLVRAALNISSVAMTSFLVIYELTAIIEDATLKTGLFIGAITIEGIIQYDLALSFAYLRQGGIKNQMKGIALLSFYGWYVVAFAIMAGIGFFTAELNTGGRSL
ncbi:hypothetical protein [Acetonema longum]|uniref:Uncharacterized protein n=1 Tax=Acetonema longum DSM 6540 TaxID=1009370 RepID=F7NEJ5_9FIRM|nr:hypothetical protein [Acetonema longum]EGO65406.1 hypothetical protein ALO_02291 [Acetonema longum DSM 6540]